MIHRTLPICQTPTWQEELKQIIRTPEELFLRLRLPDEILPEARNACKLFPLKAPRPYVDKIEPGNLNDPLLKQILPLGIEGKHIEGFSKDPVGEHSTTGIPGLIHKYDSRVLLVMSGGCAINCRYCFRRHFPYSDNNPGKQQWQKAFEYISTHPQINEVILSGGDPLVVSDDLLCWMVKQLAQIKTVNTLRIHTRLPVVIPQRITAQLLDAITHPKLKTVVVLHTNHTNEIDADYRAATELIRSANIHLLNQAVLLKSVNDSVDSLVRLSESLFSAGVLPYYLHLLDKVNGAAHFEVGDPQALKLFSEIQKRLPGYLVPKLVREIEGESSKTLII